MKKRYIVISIIVFIYFLLSIGALSSRFVFYPSASKENTVELQGTVKLTQTFSENGGSLLFYTQEHDNEFIVFSADQLVVDLPFELTKGGEVRFSILKSDEEAMLEGTQSFIRVASLSYEGTDLVTLESFNAVNEFNRASLVNSMAPLSCILGIIWLLLLACHFRERVRWKAGELSEETARQALGAFAEGEDGLRMIAEADYIKCLLSAPDDLDVQIWFSRKKHNFSSVYVRKGRQYAELSRDKQFRKEVAKELCGKVGYFRCMFFRERYYGEELTAIMNGIRRRYADKTSK